MISYTVYLYNRYTLSYRDVPDLLHERGIRVSHQTVKDWIAVDRHGVDRHGVVLDIYVSDRRNKKEALAFFQPLATHYQNSVSVRLRSYKSLVKEVFPSAKHFRGK